MARDIIARNIVASDITLPHRAIALLSHINTVLFAFTIEVEHVGSSLSVLSVLFSLAYLPQ